MLLVVMGYSEGLRFCLSFKVKVVGGGPTARCRSLVHMLLVVMGYSEGLCFCLSFKVKVVGGGPTRQSLL